MLPLDHNEERASAVPHLKCLTCRIRVQPAKVDLPVGPAPCPACGQPLEGASGPTELVGLRLAHLDLPEAAAAQVALTASDAAEITVAVQKWLDEGGS